MAENDAPVTNQTEVERLKYLEFVQIAVLHAAVYASKVYGYAKNKSGPLKPRVETMESTVKTVVGPAYDKFHDVPVEALKFVDRKLDESVSRVPPFVNHVSTKLEPVAEQYAVSAWQALNRLPLFPKVAKVVVVPTATYCSEKYNQTVQRTAEKGYKVSSYLPLVPTDRIAKVFNAVEPEVEPVARSGGEEVVVTH